MKRGFNRREVLLAGGGSLLASFLTPACVGPPTYIPLPEVGPDRDTTAFPPDHLGGTFDVREDSAFAWVAASTECVATLELWPADSNSEVVADVFLHADAGFAGAYRFSDLLPDHEYRYRAHFSNAGYGPWLRLRTAPRLQDRAPLSFIYCADIGPNAELYDIFPLLGTQQECMYLNLGDWPYSDKYPAARSIEEFRSRHREVRSPRAIQEFMWRLPIVAIFDDHDIRNGWTRSILDSDPALYAAGMQVWSEYFPSESKVHYRSFRWGSLAEFFVIDTRTYRDDPLITAPECRRFLGKAQFEWLTSGLAASDAAFKFIVTSVPFDFNGTIDDWGAFEVEKESLRAFLRDALISNVIFLTADRHWFAARHLRDGLREFQVGPLAAGLGMYPDTFPPEVVASARIRNYGAISIVPNFERQMAVFRFQCMDEEHLPVFEEIIEAPLES